MNNAQLKDISSSSTTAPNVEQEYSNETISTLTFLQGHILEEKYAGSFVQFNGRPVVLLIIFCIIAHYVFVSWRKVPISSYGLSYTSAFKRGQFWRIFTAMVGHDDILHLLFDLFILWSASALELRVGSIRFFRYTILLMLINTLVFYIIYDVIVRKCGLGSFFGNHFTTGLTPIVLGLVIILSSYQHLFDIPLFPGLLLPLAPAPFVLIFMASMIVTRSKFFQHTFGSFIGIMVVADYLTWITNYWLFSIYTWVLFLLVGSIKRTTNISIPWLEVYEWPFIDDLNDDGNNDVDDETDEPESRENVPRNRPIDRVVDITEDENPPRVHRITSILNFRRNRGNSNRNLVRARQPGTILPM
eukprot:g2326.t1